MNVAAETFGFAICTVLTLTRDVTQNRGFTVVGFMGSGAVIEGCDAVLKLTTASVGSALHGAICGAHASAETTQRCSCNRTNVHYRLEDFILSVVFSAVQHQEKWP
eukprot:479137-Amphidinium_carterae.1